MCMIMICNCYLNLVLMFQVWPDLIEGKLHEYFITFPLDHRYQRPVTSLSKKEVKVKCIKLFTRGGRIQKWLISVTLTAIRW